MSRIEETKRWMSWWGWTEDGAPGSVKLMHDGLEVAKHGDATWQADVERALELVRKERAALSASAPAQEGRDNG